MLGIAIETGAALLLFTTRGFLGSAGFVVGVSLAALGLGLWVGSEPATPLRRWIWVILAFTAAGIFTAIWRGATNEVAVSMTDERGYYAGAVTCEGTIRKVANFTTVRQKYIVTYRQDRPTRVESCVIAPE